MYGFKDFGIVELKMELGSYPPLSFLLGKAGFIYEFGCAGALDNCFKPFVSISCPYSQRLDNVSQLKSKPSHD